MKLIIQVQGNGRTGVIRKTTDGVFTEAEVSKFAKEAAEQAGVAFAKAKKAKKTT